MRQQCALRGEHAERARLLSGPRRPCPGAVSVRPDPNLLRFARFAGTAVDQGPGDLFVMRVAGNIVTPDLLASLEYGAQFLGPPLIIVLGHTGCGAVDAAIKVLKTKAVLPGHLPALIAAIKPAVIAAEKTQTGNL